jgi:hypothetical protein
MRRHSPEVRFGETSCAECRSRTDLLKCRSGNPFLTTIATGARHMRLPSFILTNSYYKISVNYGGGGVETNGRTETRNLLISRDAQNVKNSKNAANWNVSGTQPKPARTLRRNLLLEVDVAHNGKHLGQERLLPMTAMILCPASCPALRNASREESAS